MQNKTHPTYSLFFKKKVLVKCRSQKYSLFAFVFILLLHKIFATKYERLYSQTSSELLKHS